MFFDQDIKGDSLPPRTLCLTYDDGPGPATLELGRYLHSEGISATFFVLGCHAEGQADLLAQLSAWGHHLGNHTYSHPGLVSLVEAGGDAVEELARTDALLRPHVHTPFTFFRAPYGNWRQRLADTGQDRDTSIVAAVLNQSGRFPHYVGPINWDISAADYDFWRRGDSAEACAAAYLDKVRRVDHGIILMHDSSEDPEVQPRNQALQTTRLLVPVLRAEGYRFVGLDSEVRGRKSEMMRLIADS